MATLRDILKGLSDTLENLLAFTILSAGWWLGLVLIIPAPGVTIALLAAADPRIVHAAGRPGFGEAVDLVARNLRRGWSLAIVALPMLGVLAYNLWAYRDAADPVAGLAPLWIVLFLGVGGIAALALACMALFDDDLPASLRRAAAVLARRPLGALGLLCGLLLLLIPSALLVVPLLLFFPAMSAAIVDRFVLTTLALPVADPLDPTPERRAEEARERSARRFGP
jgi:hypothetical protein